MKARAYEHKDKRDSINNHDRKTGVMTQANSVRE